MNKEDKKSLILDFVKKHTLAVISTVSAEGLPEAAVIEYGETDNLELIFDTFDTSRKYKNLQKNNKAAIVIGWDENITVQYEGEVFEMSGEEIGKYKEAYFVKNPHAKKWENHEEIKYFKVIPRWIRYSDLNKLVHDQVPPWEFFEINLE